MPWCPKCKTEYIDGVSKCADCGSTLTNNPPIEPEQIRGEYVEDEAEFMTSTDDTVTSKMFEARLQSAGIPFLVKPHAGKGYIGPVVGYSVYGDDIFVPSKLLERALEAVGLEGEPLDTNNENDVDVKEEPEQQLSDNFAEETATKPMGIKEILKGVATLLVIVLVLMGYFAFDALLEFLRKLFGY